MSIAICIICPGAIVVASDSQIIAVLESPPIKSALDAVRASILADAKKGKK
jgi:hypothetical protein